MGYLTRSALLSGAAGSGLVSRGSTLLMGVRASASARLCVESGRLEVRADVGQFLRLLRLLRLLCPSLPLLAPLPSPAHLRPLFAVRTRSASEAAFSLLPEGVFGWLEARARLGLTGKKHSHLPVRPMKKGLQLAAVWPLALLAAVLFVFGDRRAVFCLSDCVWRQSVVGRDKKEPSAKMSSRVVEGGRAGETERLARGRRVKRRRENIWRIKRFIEKRERDSRRAFKNNKVSLECAQQTQASLPLGKHKLEHKRQLECVRSS